MNKNNPYLIPGAITAGVVLVLLILIVAITNANNTNKEKTETRTQSEVIPYTEEIIEDYNLFTDQTNVVMQPGVMGTLEKKYKVVSKNGTEISSTLISEERVSEPVNKIIRKGALDRDATLETINASFKSYFAALGKLDFDTLYPMLTSSDRALYTKDQLRNSAIAIKYGVENYSVTGDISFEYPKYLTDIDKTLAPVQDVKQQVSTTQGSIEEQGLVAVLPITMIITSDMIGRQEITTTVRAIQINHEWKVNYVGPTEVITIGLTQRRDDGGKTFGKTVGAEVTINHAVIFPYLASFYLDYTLTNFSERNTDAVGTFMPTDATLSNVTMYDDPNTAYKLEQNSLFTITEPSVWLGKSGIGRLIFSPTPGPSINTIYIKAQLKITNDAFYTLQTEKELKTKSYDVTIDFGSVALPRQNRQADLQKENAIINEEQRKGIDGDADSLPGTPSPASSPLNTTAN